MYCYLNRFSSHLLCTILDVLVPATSFFCGNDYVINKLRCSRFGCIILIRGSTLKYIFMFITRGMIIKPFSVYTVLCFKGFFMPYTISVHFESVDKTAEGFIVITVCVNIRKQLQSIHNIRVTGNPHALSHTQVSQLDCMYRVYFKQEGTST